MQCRKPYGPKLKKCAVGDTFLGLFIIQQNKSLIPGDREFLNNLPFDKMVRDVCPTGMKFGLPDLKWYFSFGKTVNCAGQDVFSKYIPK
ncbi:hypothetical protein MAR_013066 [Mya arenaria]|uniref:Uncharacterized protein n=2 Tax=Mya arenaria TaxID=6604 RepID=A0ABY7G0E2_MYAAR|nr:hypothetical protein MAR_013066 [Mya arenaria]